MKRIYLVLLTLAILIGIAFLVNKPIQTKAEEEDRVTICHRTNSVTNPYNKITVDEDAVDGKGNNDHTKHTGPVATNQAVAQALKDDHKKWGDIIPDILNWDEDGQLIYRNDCNYSEPTPTPTDIPPSCEQEEWSCRECQVTPEDENVCYNDKINFCGEEYNCRFEYSNGELGLTNHVEGSQWICEDTCEPEPTPTPEPCKGTDENGHECGWSPELYKAPEYKVPVCSVPLPTKPSFTYGRKDATTVQIKWNENDTNTTHWAVTYGYEQDNLPYGIPFLPKEARSAVISGLIPNHIVWIQLWRFNTGECVVLSDRLDP